MTKSPEPDRANRQTIPSSVSTIPSSVRAQTTREPSWRRDTKPTGIKDLWSPHQPASFDIHDRVIA
jgi:hypothetical protein